MLMVGTISSMYGNNPQDSNGRSGASIFVDAATSVTVSDTSRFVEKGTTSEIGVQTDSLLSMFRSLLGMQYTATVVTKKLTVPSLDSLDLDPDFSKFGTDNAPPTGCRYIGNIESLRLQNLCDQHLHACDVGVTAIEEAIPRSSDARAIEEAIPRSSAEHSSHVHEVGTLPEGPYMFPVVFKPSCEYIIEEFNKQKGIIQGRKFKRKLSVKQQSLTKPKAGKMSDRLTGLEISRYKDRAPKSEQDAIREAFTLYAKVNGVPDNEESFTKWWTDMCNNLEVVRGAIQRRTAEKKGIPHYDIGDADNDPEPSSGYDLGIHDSIESAYEHLATKGDGKYEELMIDPGASLHLYDINKLTPEMQKTVRRLKSPLILSTANGKVHAQHCVKLFVEKFNTTCTFVLMRGAPSLISLGCLCQRLTDPFQFHWEQIRNNDAETDDWTGIPYTAPYMRTA
jgi:hypothetical protein